MIETIENSLGVKLPLEIKELYENIALLEGVKFLFDTRKLGNHWLLNSNYFLVTPKEINTKDRGKYYINEHYVNTGENILCSINFKILKSIKEYWSENKVFVLAWSNEVVEKDASLLYVFNDDNTIKGVYIHSLNYVQEKVFLGKNLKDFFDLQVPDCLNDDVYQFPLLTSDSTILYKDVLQNNFKILDIESVDDVLDYRYVIDLLSNLSGNKFSFEIQSLNEIDSVRFINVSLAGKEFTYELEGNTKYLDLKLFKEINKSLLEIGFKRKQFVLFSDVAFGQEIGVAFIGRSRQKQLSELKTITFL